VLRLDADRRCADARLAFTGVGPGPVRATDAEASLKGNRLSDAVITEACRLAQTALDPDGDIHASAAYRKHVAGVLAGRALRQAAERAKPS
jgi:carbon-monoxide dehydrogenase medium subunit